MGGGNQGTCSSLPPGGGFNSVRYHEVISRGEVDFHDDSAGLKCSVDSASFFSAYNPWRVTMSEKLVLAGNDGSGGHASVTFVPYVDNRGDMQVSLTVNKATMGNSILDLDKLAHYS